MTEHTPSPWTDETGNWLFEPHKLLTRLPDALLMAAAPDLFEAALRLDVAEIAHANCDECEGEEVPELCPKCFPLFDDARVMRRLAIEKARGRVASADGVREDGK